MPSKKHCPFCNQLVEQDEQVCPHCGGENRTPKTIEGLLAYCEKRQMPLHRMRFFIGENYQKARAFMRTAAGILSIRTRPTGNGPPVTAARMRRMPSGNCFRSCWMNAIRGIFIRTENRHTKPGTIHGPATSFRQRKR